MPKRPAEALLESPKPSKAPTLQFLDEQKKENYLAEKQRNGKKFSEVSNRLRRTLFFPLSNSVRNHDKQREDRRKQNKKLARQARQARQALQQSEKAAYRQARFNQAINSV